MVSLHQKMSRTPEEAGRHLIVSRLPHMLLLGATVAAHIFCNT